MDTNEHNSTLKTVGPQTARLLSQLHDHNKTVFTTPEAAKLTGLSPQGTSSLLHKAVYRGLFSRIRPGLFTIVPSELGSTKEFPGNPYLIAREIAGEAPYYISHSTAMDIHRMVTQPQLGIYVSSLKRFRNQTLSNTRYHFVLTQVEQLFGAQRYWVTKQESVEVSDLERTVIDGLRQPEYSGGITEVAKGFLMRRKDMDLQKACRITPLLPPWGRCGHPAFGIPARGLSYGLRVAKRRTSERAHPNLFPSRSSFAQGGQIQLSVEAAPQRDARGARLDRHHLNDHPTESFTSNSRTRLASDGGQPRI